MHWLLRTDVRMVRVARNTPALGHGEYDGEECEQAEDVGHDAPCSRRWARWPCKKRWAGAVR